jgi:hypothetical protein
MEEGEGTGFFVKRVLLFDGSGPLVDLVVAGGVQYVGAVGGEGVVLFCLGKEEGSIAPAFGVC